METQSAKNTQGLPDGLLAWRYSLPIAYQSTGAETRFTNGLDPGPRSRPVFAFHRPELLAEWLAYLAASPGNPIGLPSRMPPSFPTCKACRC